MGGIEAMKEGETPALQIKVLDDGLIKARRKDGRKLNEDDWQQVTKWVDSQPGVTVDDVLRIFPGAEVVSKT
jgi:hypothetical protein